MWTIITVVIVLLVLLILLFRWAGRSAAKDLELARRSDFRDAIVVSVEQVSAPPEGGEPKLKMQLRFTESGGVERLAELIDTVDYANIPRPGDAVIVSVDRLDLSRMKYKMLKVNQKPATLFAIDYFDLQRRGIRSGKVISVKQLAPKAATPGQINEVGPLELQVKIDSVTGAPRFVSFRQETLDYLPGFLESIYVFVAPVKDPIRGDSEEVTAVALRLTGGLRRSAKDPRLDRLALGPSIRSAGREAHGTVLEAKEVWIGAAYLRDSGQRRFHLRFHVAPTDGGPVYETEQEMTFTDEERIQRICRVGASVPLRCDWNDPKTVVTDGGALGYPDPYPLAIERWNEAVRNGTANKL